MATQFYNYSAPFLLESGEYLPEFRLAYQTWGTLNSSKNNVLWVCHAFTGSADAADWWSGILGEKRLYNFSEYFVICANVLGSHYGSTSPLSVNILSNEPYYHNFPTVTIKDNIRAFDLLREHLGIPKIHTCIGGSMGGQQALEWAITFPECIENLILIATNAQHSPWGIAFDESQRMAIQADPTWQERHPQAGINGMKVARSIALLSYRNYETYLATQSREDAGHLGDYRAAAYQRYQGDKLATRFNAFSYWVLSSIMDSHDVGRGRGGVVNALQHIKARTLVMGVRSDVLFPFSEQEFLAKHIPNASFFEIDSLYGHDGFLIEIEQLTRGISNWYGKKNTIALAKDYTSFETNEML